MHPPTPHRSKKIIAVRSLVSPRCMAVLLVTGVLSVSSGGGWLSAAIAANVAPQSISQPKPTVLLARRVGGSGKNNELLPSTPFPPPVGNLIRQDLARRLNVSPGKLQVTLAEPKVWKDSCLELAATNEFCTQAATPGWQVTVARRQQQLVYRTNESGSVIKLDPAASRLDPGGLPQSISRAVLQAAAQQLQVPTARLRIVQSENTTWPDACLGLATSGTFCAAVVVPGWLVTVESGSQRLVYRTNDSGSLVKFDRQASNVSGATGLQPNLISGSEFIPPLPTGAVFRGVTRGGIAGQTSAMLLQANGQLIQGQLQPNGTVTPVKVVQVSPAEVQRFRQLLEQQNFAQFNRHSYPAPQGSADYFTVTLSAPTVTARYADIVSDQLPAELKTVVQAWSRIAAKL